MNPNAVDARSGPRRIGLDACCFVGRPTGIANYVAALLRPLCEQHPEAEFYLYSNEAAAFECPPNAQIRVSTPRRRGPIWQNTQLVDMVEQDDIDVFWGTNGVIPLRRLRRTATVVTVHDLVHRFYPQTQLPMIRWKQRVFGPLCARAADRVVAISQATAADVKAFYRRPADAVIQPLVGAIYGHAGADEIESGLADLRLPERFILSVGTLEPRKNIAALIEAHWACRQAGLELPPLVLVGSHGWRNQRLHDLIAGSEALGAVRFLGYVENPQLALLYARCAMFVMPSMYEGFGMPLLEAQICGAPVVHGSHPSMCEAAGGLGVAVGTDRASLIRMLEQFARQELPLACRLPATIDNDAVESAQRLWQVMLDAWGRKNLP